MSLPFKPGTRRTELKPLTGPRSDLEDRPAPLDEAAGVRPWQVSAVDASASHPRSRWTWPPNARCPLELESEADDLPDFAGSWADRLRSDDAVATVAAVTPHFDDASPARFDVTHRLEILDGSHRSVRATGGCRHAAAAKTTRACGSLGDVDVHTPRQAGETGFAVSDSASIARDKGTVPRADSTAVNQIDQVTRHNGAMVQQSTTASRNLSHEAGEITRLLGRFVLGQTVTADMTAPSGRPARATTSWASGSARPIARATPMLKTMGKRGGSAAITMNAPVQATESSEEF